MNSLEKVTVSNSEWDREMQLDNTFSFSLCPSQAVHCCTDTPNQLYSLLHSIYTSLL
jgi:hypothetical protein